MGVSGSLDLDLCLRSGQVFRWTQEPDGSWVGVDGDRWFRFPPDTIPEDVPARRLFQLDHDFVPILLERGPELTEAVASHPGLRLLRPSSPTEVLFCFLCSANNSLHRIYPMCQSLGAMGDPFPDQPTMTRFPEIEVLAQVDEAHLRALKFGYRGRTIPMAARALAERGGSLWLEQLKEIPYQEARHELQTLPGIGPKVADCVCLYGLHFSEATPTDTHLWQALARTYFPDWVGQPLTRARYEYSAEFLRDRFGDLAGFAQLILYHDNLRRKHA